MGSCTSNNTVAPYSLKRTQMNCIRKFGGISSGKERLRNVSREETSSEAISIYCQHLDAKEQFELFASVRRCGVSRPQQRQTESKDEDEDSSEFWVKCDCCVSWFVSSSEYRRETVPIVEKHPFEYSALSLRRARKKDGSSGDSQPGVVGSRVKDTATKPLESESKKTPAYQPSSLRLGDC